MGRIAKEKKIKSSKQRAAEMAEGYKAKVKEQKQFAAMASRVENEVLAEQNEWLNQAT